MENINNTLARIKIMLWPVKFEIFGKTFKINAEIDKKYGNRIYIQVSYVDKCRVLDTDAEWHGRKWYLSDHMTTDEIVKTAYAACKAAVEHEVMEGFTYEGTVLFNPHIKFEALLRISNTNNEVRRDNHGKYS